MLRTEFVPSVEKRKWVMWVRCWVLPPPLSCLTRLDFSYHSSAALWPVHTHIWWVMKTETSLFSKLSFALFPPCCFSSTCLIWPVCVFALPPHWACVFVCLCPQKGLKNVFDEAILAALEPPEPKKKRKCVLLWEVAPLFRAHTRITHTYIHLKQTHTHTHTQTHTLTPHPFPCFAKAGWQHCPPQGRLEGAQPTKF